MAAMKSPSVRTAVLIGYGSMGRYHAALLLDRYEELAILDSNDQARVQASISYPKAIVAAGLSELDSIKWEWGNTLAVIATWGPSHAALFTDLANRGVKRVLCEKPLAHSVKAGAEMVREAEKQGIALGIHQHVRYSELVNGLHSLSKSLAIGEPCGIFIHGGAAGVAVRGRQHDRAGPVLLHGPAAGDRAEKRAGSRLVEADDRVVRDRALQARRSADEPTSRHRRPAGIAVRPAEPSVSVPASRLSPLDSVLEPESVSVPTPVFVSVPPTERLPE